MPERTSLRTAFLNGAGWGRAVTSDLAGDASNRRYFRLVLESKRAVLMDAPPATGEDVAPFVKISEFLRDRGLSAPEVLSEDREAGFLLLEDLGDDLFARVVKADPDTEELLYQEATDVLIALHEADVPPDLEVYDPKSMAKLASLAFQWYATGVTQEDLTGRQNAFARGFAQVLSSLPDLSEVLIQRDYHAENLLWLPDRSGVARVGLLDFQDAMAGHRAYDLVSLLQDARRDVSPQIEAAMIDRYLSATRLNRATFERAYALLGLQRNLRIIGVFARLCLRDRKPQYIDMIPRVWAHMIRDLEWANLGELENDVRANLPIPDAQARDILRRKCGTIPAL